MADIAETFAPGGWEFTPEVTEVFDEHVSASVPFYGVIQQLIAEASDWLLPNGGRFVDLGASTGTTLAAIASRHPDRHIRAHLYDEVPEMLDQAAEKLRGFSNLRVERHQQKLEAAMGHANSDLVVSLFTLQFLRPSHRSAVLTAARQRSETSGAIIVAEKVRPTHSLWAEIANDVSHDFKVTSGLDSEAIRSKARALRGVLLPQTVDSLRSELTLAGWHNPEVLFRWHSWVVMAATA